MTLQFKLFPRNESPGYLICQAATRLKAGLYRAFQSHGLNVTPEQWTVLSSLWEADNVHQSVLADKTAKDRHNIARILHLLERGGLVKRVADPNDRRLRKVCLTEKGKALKPKLVRIAEDFLQQSLSGLRQKDLDSLTTAMAQIINNIPGVCDSAEVSRSSRSDWSGVVAESRRRSVEKLSGNV
jgi:DNA-binding MarR family transcriptional regulator